MPKSPPGAYYGCDIVFPHMTLNNILKWTAITGVFSVFIIPFIVPGSMFFPFITGKGFFFRVVVEIAFAAWAILAIRDASVRPRTSWLLWAFVAFAGIIAIADIFGMNPWKSFWSNFERMEGYITTIHLLLYFIVASSILATEKLWQRFFECSLWSSLIVSIYSIFQLAGKVTINQGGVRVDATFGNATYLAIFLVFNIFFALILITRDRILWKKITYSIIALLHVVILYHTATRGAILGLIGGLLVSGILIALFDNGEKRLRIIAGSIVGGAVLLVLGFIAVKDASFVTSSPVLSRFASISWNETKTQARAYIWPMAVKGWESGPKTILIGWGQENFNYIFNANYDPRMYSQEQWFDHTHNTLLDWLVAGGLLGLLAYLSLFGAAGWLIWKQSIDMSFTEKALLTGLGAAYFFHNLFVFDNIVSYVLFVALLAYVQWKSTRLVKPLASRAGKSDEADTRMLGSLVLVVLVFCLYFFNWRGYETNRYLIDALRATSQGPTQAPTTVASYEKALSYDTLGRPEVVERLVDASRSINVPEVSLELRQKFAEMAKKAVDTQIERFPGDARYETFAGSFYGFYGQMADAEKHFVAAANLSPRKQSILFQLGNFYVSTKQYDKAITVFKKAYDLDTTYADAANYYALALLYAGREEESKAFLNSLGGTLTSDTVLQAYINTGKWDKAVPLLKAKIAANPSDMTSRQNLAAAYYQMGNKAGAIATVQEMIRITPSFKAQGEQLIQQIEAGQ